MAGATERAALASVPRIISGDRGLGLVAERSSLDQLSDVILTEILKIDLKPGPQNLAKSTISQCPLIIITWFLLVLPECFLLYALKNLN